MMHSKPILMLAGVLMGSVLAQADGEKMLGNYSLFSRSYDLSMETCRTSLKEIPSRPVKDKDGKPVLDKDQKPVMTVQEYQCALANKKPLRVFNQETDVILTPLSIAIRENAKPVEPSKDFKCMIRPGTAISKEGNMIAYFRIIAVNEKKDGPAPKISLATATDCLDQLDKISFLSPLHMVDETFVPAKKQ